MLHDSTGNIYERRQEKGQRYLIHIMVKLNDPKKSRNNVWYPCFGILAEKFLCSVQSESQLTYHVPTDFSTMLPSSLTSFFLALFTPFRYVLCECVQSNVRFCMGPLLLYNRLVSCIQKLLRRSFDADQLVDFFFQCNVFYYKFCL